MARRKTAAQLERQLKYAKAREAHKRPEREQGAPTRRIPRIALAYKPLIIADGVQAKKYMVQASKEAVSFFTQAALNLTSVSGDEPLPRGAQPCKVHATVADSTPTVVRAEASKRAYIRYGKGTRGSNSQYTYVAPFSIKTVTAMDSEITALFNSVKGKLGGSYGRVWFTPEFFVTSDGGQ